MASQVDPGSGPVVVPLARQSEQVSLATLLQFEGDIRRQLTVNELSYFVANEMRRVVSYDQLFILKRPAAGEHWQVSTVSSLAMVDRNAPLVQAIERVVSGLSDLSVVREFDITALTDDPAIAEYPYHAFFWQPLHDRDGKAFAGLLLARTEPCRENETNRLDRVSGTTSHAWLALTGGRPVRRWPKLDSKRKSWAALALLALALFPVRLSVLAPVEVVAARPFIVSAPFAGVVERIHVAPNAQVRAGDPLLSFEDIKVRNEMQQALERLEVAKAKIERSTSAAFGKAEEAREIATTRAEYQVALADYNYARDLMKKSAIRAPVAGMAIYSDRRDWEGRAVNVGDPILQIANPREASYRIDVPTKEQISLQPGASTKIWLDAQPLWALEGMVEQASYQARPTAEGILAFAVIAKPAGEIPRIGSRGTAKLYGRWVPLSYSILKRPIASVRQFFGI